MKLQTFGSDLMKASQTFLKQIGITDLQLEHSPSHTASVLIIRNFSAHKFYYQKTAEFQLFYFHQSWCLINTGLKRPA